MTLSGRLPKPSELEGGSLTRRPFPAATAGLLATGLLGHALFPASDLARWTWLPLDALGIPGLLLATGAGIFMHPDTGHWVTHLALVVFFGLIIERHCGWGRLLSAVFLGIVLASLISVNQLLSALATDSAAVPGIRLEPVGVSGAVAGLMGVYAIEVRSRLPRFVRPIRLRSLQPLWAGGVLLTLAYMLGDITGGAVDVAGFRTIVNGWPQIGAFAGGMAVAAVAAVTDVEAGSGGAAASTGEDRTTTPSEPCPCPSGLPWGPALK